MLSSLSSAAPLAPDAIKDVSLSTFKADVLEASLTSLVIVDFWATWCGPCKQLTPVLEKIAHESKGTVKLAKIDVDKNQPIAQQMGVQSIPAVFAFFQGRPVDGFAGALPEAQVKAWVDQLVKQTGSTGDPEKEDLESALAQAADFLLQKDFATAAAIYTDILDREPLNALAYAGMARCLIEQGDTVKARDMVEKAPAEIAKDKALVPLKTALELAEQAGKEAGQAADLEAKLLQNPDDHQTRFDLALAHYASGQREQAVDDLLEIVRRSRSWNEDAARKQLVKFFEVFGVMDPLTVSARKRLSSILFS
jgi:putative thioredoxin